MPDTPPVYLKVEINGSTHEELWTNLLELVSQAIESKYQNGHTWPKMVGSNAGSITVKKKTESSQEIKIHVKECVNKAGVTIWEFFNDDKLLGHMYKTYKYGWYEAFLDNGLRGSKRIQSEEEAAAWIFQKHFKNA